MSLGPLPPSFFPAVFPGFHLGLHQKLCKQFFPGERSARVEGFLL